MDIKQGVSPEVQDVGEVNHVSSVFLRESLYMALRENTSSRLPQEDRRWEYSKATATRMEY